MNGTRLGRFGLSGLRHVASPAAAFAVAMLAGGTAVVANTPDLVVSELPSITLVGALDGRSAYGFATVSCNKGDAPVGWSFATSAHPVFAQNLYRLSGGRFEQLGLGWARHGFAALAQNVCGACEPPGTVSLLGVGCATPDSGAINAYQFQMGPRFDVNASTGAFPFPVASKGPGATSLDKRLHVANADLDPQQNAGALYFAETVVVAADDAVAGHGANNATWRQVVIGPPSGGGFSALMTGPAHAGEAALGAWALDDPAVEIAALDVPGDGRIFIASRVTDNGDGTWHYEYAISNLSSHRSVGSFAVPIGSDVTVSNEGFHDVDYHSGEPYDPTDWTIEITLGTVEWFTQTHDENDLANAIRWGTLYNFFFDADLAPCAGNGAIGLFRPGEPAAVGVSIPAPMFFAAADLDGSGDIGFGDMTLVLISWGTCQGAAPCPTDLDESGDTGFGDLVRILLEWGSCS